MSKEAWVDISSKTVVCPFLKEAINCADDIARDDAGRDDFENPRLDYVQTGISKHRCGSGESQCPECDLRVKVKLTGVSEDHTATCENGAKIPMKAYNFVHPECAVNVSIGKGVCPLLEEGENLTRE